MLISRGASMHIVLVFRLWALPADVTSLSAIVPLNILLQWTGVEVSTVLSNFETLCAPIKGTLPLPLLLRRDLLGLRCHGQLFCALNRAHII
jgi:hypothetical protein